MPDAVAMCPGCRQQFLVAVGTGRAGCPSCNETIVWQQCAKSSWEGPVLERWTTFTHPGCTQQHPGPGLAYSKKNLSEVATRTESGLLCPKCGGSTFKARRSTGQRAGLTGALLAGMLTGGVAAVGWLAAGAAGAARATRVTCVTCGTVFNRG
jgi:hypothetical protein